MSAHAPFISSPVNLDRSPVAVLPGAEQAPVSRLRWFRTDRWTAGHLVAAGLMGALAFLATFDAWNDIFRLARAPSWTDGENTHILLVPIVAAWMVIVRQRRIRHCKPSGTIIGVLIAIMGWVVYLTGYYRGYFSLWHAGAVLVMLGCVLSVLGKQALFRFLPAVAVLVFLIPVPTQYRLKIAGPLQAWTAEISQRVLELVGVPVERAESRLTINGIPVDIIEACNGLRGVFCLILVSYAFSFGLPLRNGVRLVVLLASPLSAIFCNVVRIVPTVWIYGYYSRDADVSNRVGFLFHAVSGWLMLPVAFLILLGIIKVLRWAMVPVMRYTLAA
jgi:exosortase